MKKEHDEKSITIQASIRPAKSGNSGFGIEHLCGGYDQCWKVVASPNVGSSSNDLVSVAAIAAKNVVAVGTTYSSGNSIALILGWNGSSWKPVASPTQPNVQLSGVARVTGTSQLWAVGSDSTGTLTETNC